jgi:RNA polymerase sigma factor (sigma-70 family)
MSRMQSPAFVGHLKTLFGAGTLSGLGEGELLERFLSQRDETAFEEIMARHGPMVLGICRRWLDDPHEVDDAFQAVFLILVRNAAAMRNRNSLSSWLYGISLRVAQRARSNAARRHSRERQDPDGLSMAQSKEHPPTNHETSLILDEEIRLLPERQQAAIVLCLVRGKTHEAAAAELGIPLGTVKSRLAGGRATLVRRLSRRGVAPSIALGTASVSEHLLASAIPQELARQTLEAAMRLAISRALRGAAIVASVQNLVKGVLSAMRFARMKSVVMGLAVVGILVGTSTALVLAQAGRAHVPVPVAPAQNAAVPASPPRLDLYGDPLPSGAITRFGTIRHRQEAPIYRIAFTRDDRFIVTDGDDSQLRVWDARDGKLLRRIGVDIEALTDFALSSNGKTVAIAGVNLVPGKGGVRRVDFRELATGRQVSAGSWVEHSTFPRVAIDPDRRLLVTASPEGELEVVNIKTGTQTARLNLENEGVDFIAFSADRNRLAVAGSVKGNTTFHGRRLRVFDLKSASDFRSVAKFDANVGDLAFSPDGSLFAGSDVGTLIFLDVPSGRSQRIENAFMREVAFSADGQRLVGSRLNDLALWSPSERKYINKLDSSCRLSGQLAFSFDGRTVAANGGRNVLHLWDIASGHEQDVPRDAHEEPVSAAVVTPDGEKLITASADRTMRVWSMATGRQLKVLNQPDTVVTMVSSRDGRSVLAGMRFNAGTYLWVVAGDGSPAFFDAPEDRRGRMKSSFGMIALGFADQDRSVLSFSAGGQLRRWSAKERRIQSDVSLSSLIEPMPIKTEIKGTFSAAMFFAGGRKLAAIDSGLHIIDVASGKETGRVGRADRDGLVAVSPTNQTLAITRPGSPIAFKRMGNGESTDVHSSAKIVLLDANTCGENHQIDIAGSDVWALAFSPEGKTLAATSGWETGQIHLYEVASGQELRTIDTPAIRTPALTFSPDGSKLICGMADTSVLVWDLHAKP